MKLILVHLIFLLSIIELTAQEIIITSGGNAVGNGSVSYSIGQTFVTANFSNSGSIAEGIQQSIEIFTLSNSNLKAVNLEAITYPNPTKDYINLKLNNDLFNSLEYTIFNVNGKSIKSGKVVEKNNKIKIQHFTKGIYFLKVTQNNSSLKVFKIIKN